MNGPKFANGKDLLRRLRSGWRWVAAQFAGTALLILLGIGWTRLPEKHVWQVVLTLVLPPLLAAAALILQAGTMRRFVEDDKRRVRLVWGALTLLLWLLAAFICWALLDWFDDQIGNWASYLNSQAPAHWRARILTYEHLMRGLHLIEWLLRWVAVPGNLILYAVCTAQWGWRLPWRRLWRVLVSWRWWPAVVLAALLGEALPASFFVSAPTGNVSAQVWHVGLKLAGAYLLAVASWVLLLGWSATLLMRTEAPRQPADEELVAVPVLTGPKGGMRTATAELPLPENEDTQ